MDLLLRRNYIHVSALYRRSVWEQNCGYDVTMLLQGFEDWDFWLGALEHGWQFAYVPEIFFDYRIAKVSMVTRTRGYEAQVEEFIMKKHGMPLWKSLARARTRARSVKATSRNLGRLLKSRLKEKLAKHNANGNADR